MRAISRRQQVQQHRVGVFAAVDHPVARRTVKGSGGVGAVHAEADVLKD